MNRSRFSFRADSCRPTEPCFRWDPSRIRTGGFRGEMCQDYAKADVLRRCGPSPNYSGHLFVLPRLSEYVLALGCCLRFQSTTRSGCARVASTWTFTSKSSGCTTNMLPTRRAIEIKFPTTHCTSLLSLSLSLSCLRSSKPIQIGVCMLISLSIHLHGLHLDVQYGQTWHLSTQLRSGQRTGRRLLCSTTTVTDPTIRQPGFHLPRHAWSLMNRFRTGQGPCRVNLYKRDRQIGLYMLLSLSIHLHGLHLDAQYGQESCQYSSNCGDDDTPS